MSTTYAFISREQVRILVEPLPKESSDEDDDFVRNQVSVNFADDDKDSKAFEESALKGANDALYAGPMAGYPVTRARVEIQQIEPHNACNPAIVRLTFENIISNN